ncbi:MAG TPA: hypothetical protein VF244_08785, partial [Acidimicrobiales bacterium]
MSSSKAEAGRTVLILRALGIGDLLTAVPALRAIAGAYPDHHRVLATQPKLTGLAVALGAVDEVVDAGTYLGRWPAVRPAPEVCVNLHSASPTTYRLLLATGPSVLIGYRNPEVRQTLAFPELRDGEHEVERWCRVLAERGIDVDPTALDIELPPGPVPEGARGG